MDEYKQHNHQGDEGVGPLEAALTAVIRQPVSAKCEPLLEDYFLGHSHLRPDVSLTSRDSSTITDTYIIVIPVDCCLDVMS